MAAVLEGKADAVVLTGNLCKADTVMAEIRRRVIFIAPLLIFQGGDQMEVLAKGGIDVFRQKESAKEY